MTRPLKLAGAEAKREPEACGDVAAWLEVVVRLSGLPEGERGQVRDELRDHIEGRVRDLMLTGRGEAEAGAEAIGELGDAAELARNLRAARRRPQRRRLMATMIGAAVLAAVGVAATVWQPGGHPVPVAAYVPEQGPDAAALAKAKVTLRGDSDWGDFFKMAGEASHSPVTVHWAALRSAGGTDDAAILPDGKLGLEVDSLPLPMTLELLNDRMGLNGSQRVEWRMVEGTLLFATRGFFDRSETVLRTYDLSSLPGIESGGDFAVERARELIQKTAEPEAWDLAGGTSTVAAYGTKLFVKAPPRVQAGVEWVLGELRAGEKRAGGELQTRVFALRRVDAARASEVVRNLLATARAGVKATTITADARTNSILVSGTPEALMMVEGCLAGMDQGAPAGEVQTRAIALKTMDAGEAMKIAQAMMTLGLRGRLEGATADAATNSLVVKGTADALDELQKRLAEADHDAGVRKGAGGVGAAQDDGKDGVPAAVLRNIGPGEVVRLLHADAGELAPVVARRLVEWSREVGGERFVVTGEGEGGVLVAGTPLARGRATAMLRELDEAVGRGGRTGDALNGGALGASATMTGLRRTGVPVLSDVPIISRMFTNEEPAPLVIRAEGGLIRVTAPDGTSVETEEIRVAPSPR